MFSSRKGPNSLPSRLTTLGISWVNNQFKALAVHRGVIAGTFEDNSQNDAPGRFEALIREAVQQTGYRGHTVSLLLGHPRLVQQLVDVPHVKGAPLNRILERQAQQQKMFVGEAAWAAQTSTSEKPDTRVVMHLFPRMLLNQFVQACQRNDLYLVSVLPISAVLHQQSQQLRLNKGEVALLAAETGGSTTVVISSGEGQLILARTLQGTWNESAERLGLDLNRTVTFVNQQYSVAINKGIWLFGTGAEEQAEAIAKYVQLPVEVSPVKYEPVYWAREALRLPPAQSPNLISRVAQKAPQRRAFAKVVAAATVFMVLALLGLSAYATYQARQEAADIQTLSQHVRRLQAHQIELQARAVRLTHNEQTANLVLNGRPSPVPAWFLGYLSEAVPSELVVTNLQVKREADAWKVHLAGAYQTAIREPTPAILAQAVTVLSNRMANGPFHLALASVEDQDQLAPNPTGLGGRIGTWVANVASGIQAKPQPTNQFALEGMMR